MTDTCLDCGKDLNWHRLAGDNVNSGRCPSCFRTHERREIAAEYRRCQREDDARDGAVSVSADEAWDRLRHARAFGTEEEFAAAARDFYGIGGAS